MFPLRYRSLICSATLCLAAAACDAAQPDPFEIVEPAPSSVAGKADGLSLAQAAEGIYFNEFSGGFSGDEYFEVRFLGTTAAGDAVLSMRDIAGGGFRGIIDDEGAITLENGLGVGSFVPPDRLIVEPSLGGTPFLFDCVRVPGTDQEFPLTLDAGTVPADPAVQGDYAATLNAIDPVTGATLSSGNLQVTVATGGDLVRLTFGGGAFVQGAFDQPDRAAIRVSANASNPDFATFDGGGTNLSQDVLGEVVFDGGESFSAVLLLQSRDPLGQQTQQVFHLDGARL